MSSLSSSPFGINGLSQFFQSISGTSTTTATAPATATAATDPTQSGSDGGVQAAGGHHHHHHGHGGAQFKKIEDAVTSALQNAQSDPSADPNKVIQDAIEKVFQDNGTGATTSSSTSSTGNAQTTGSDADGSAGSNASAPGVGGATAGASGHQAFVQLLQSLGVSAQQFHQDFLNAIQDVRNGQQADPSSVFQSFPPGSTVDTTA